jgi:hypothetical protein
VSDIVGNTPRAQEKIGLVMKSRRKLMAITSWLAARLAPRVKPNVRLAPHVKPNVRLAPHLGQTTVHPS